jgi:hypothetical protein
MKPFHFLFVVLCCGALARGLSIAVDFNHDSQPAPSKNRSQSGGDHPSEQGQNQGKGDQEDGNPPYKTRDGDPALSKSYPADLNERREAQRRGERLGEQHPGQRPSPDKGHQARAGKTKPNPHSGQESPRAAASNRGQTRSAPINAAGPYQPALIPFAGEPKDSRKAVERQRNPALPPCSGQTPAALPVSPAHDRSLVPAAIGGTRLSSGARNTVPLNGTSLKHKP